MIAQLNKPVNENPQEVRQRARLKPKKKNMPRIDQTENEKFLLDRFLLKTIFFFISSARFRRFFCFVLFTKIIIYLVIEENEETKVKYV